MASLRKKRDCHKTKGISDEHIIAHNNEIIRFGGINVYTGQYLDHFIVGRMNVDDNNKTKIVVSMV